MNSNHQINNPVSTAYRSEDLSIDLNCQGNNEYIKVSYPVKYGIFSRLETQDYIFEFNLNNEIRHAKSKKKGWIHPSEWLKRTIGNDWIYYSTGGYSGVYEALGEYYLPNLMYPTNSLIGGRPFEEPEISTIVKNWHLILSELPDIHMAAPFQQWVDNIKSHSPESLQQKADLLFDISGSRVSVIPPDARHVDYNIIPINIVDGCLYKCQFCKVKNKKKICLRSRQDISHQMVQLNRFLGRDIINYNAVFLGEHDALYAPSTLILETAQEAYHTFGFYNSYMKGNYLFMFGSVDSLLNTDKHLFQELNRLDFKTFINIGLESYDQTTLTCLGKPITPRKVAQAFEQMQYINHKFQNIELTGNFIMDESLPDSHYDTLITLIRGNINQTKPKGTVYLSPVTFGSPSRQVLYDFYKLKALSRYPMFLYIIQRL